MIKHSSYNAFYEKCNKYDFEKLFKRKGYAYFTKGTYNLNIIGVRKENKNQVTNVFDDILVVIYSTEVGVTRRLYHITTEPGTYFMQKQLGNLKGTAILVPNQYRSTWKLDLHRGKYKALCQRKPVKVYRDNNKDNIYDLDIAKTDTGLFGINIHRANANWVRNTVDQYSAGCQVFSDPKEFASFIRLCEKQKELYGNSFTYTLLDEKDLV